MLCSFQNYSPSIGSKKINNFSSDLIQCITPNRPLTNISSSKACSDLYHLKLSKSGFCIRNTAGFHVISRLNFIRVSKMDSSSQSFSASISASQKISHTHTEEFGILENDSIFTECYSNNGASSHPKFPTMNEALSNSNVDLQPKLHAKINAESIPNPSLVIFSGGTAFNGMIEEMKKFTTNVAHVLPVSDDGGSTAEIVRVLGGPAIGDIRSRCLRLSDDSSSEAKAVKTLLAHRLPMGRKESKTEWLSIVEGEHELWEGVSDPYKETIRAFLVHFQHQILQHSSDKFCFQYGSVGNFFFTGARTFFRSLDAAIFLFSRVSHIPTDSFVLPCISTNDRLTLGAELVDGSIIRGQHEISHPNEINNPCDSPMHVNKDQCLPLSSPLKRIFYMSSEGTNLLHEVFPSVNSSVLEKISNTNAIIYGVGSLYTSICPSLVLHGVGEAIASKKCPKILLLNGKYDRETFGMNASDFVLAISESLNRCYTEDSDRCLYNDPSDYVTYLLAPKEGNIPVDLQHLNALGVQKVVIIDSDGEYYNAKTLMKEIEKIVNEYAHYDS